MKSKRQTEKSNSFFAELMRGVVIQKCGPQKYTEILMPSYDRPLEKFEQLNCKFWDLVTHTVTVKTEFIRHISYTDLIWFRNIQFFLLVSLSFEWMKRLGWKLRTVWSTANYYQDESRGHVRICNSPLVNFLSAYLCSRRVCLAKKNSFQISNFYCVIIAW